jgi:catechol 2,3-dioxygenase-like lactoylglutathione lyase family enzyme
VKRETAESTHDSCRARLRGVPDRVVFNHVGQVVTDLERSKRFYVELLEFSELREIHPGDELSAKLMRLEPPLEMTATYLQRDGLVLELLHFAAAGQTQPYEPRAMNQPGLTHVSVSVADIDAILDRIGEYGGAAVAGTNIGYGVFVRDPDGQLLELLPMSYRESLRERAPDQ